MTKLQQHYKKLVKFFGTQDMTASQLGVKQPSVQAWISGRSKMSVLSAQKAEKLTNGQFRAVDLCPKLKELEDLSPPKDTP